MTTHEPKATDAGWAELFEGGRFLKLVLLCLGVWLHAADALLAATTMPSAVEEIGGVAYISWTIALYQLGSIIAGAVTGLLAVRHGLRLTTIAAAAVYAVGCIASAVAPDMATMLIGRTLQGLGGGCLVAVAFVAAGQLFPDRLIPRTMAVISGIWGASAFCGPLIGGAFASAGLWRMAFWAFAAQALVLIIAAIFLLRDSADETAQQRKPDRDGAPVRRLAILCIAVLAIAAAGAEVTVLRSAVLVLIGVAAFVVFFKLDAKAGNRLFPRRPLDIRHRVGAGLLMILLLAIATMSFTTYGPLLMRVLYGIDPLGAGYLIAVESVGWTLAAIAFASAAVRYEGSIIKAGSVLITAGLIGFAFAMPSNSLTGLFVAAVATGAGFGMFWGFVVRRVVAAAASNERETASSALPTIHLIGYAVGSAATGIVANAAGFADGVTVENAQVVAFWVFAAFLPIALFGNIAAWRLARDPA